MLLGFPHQDNFVLSSQVCQCFVFCALLEFALVNYASRSDMQRDRARERMERARRQWELEHADMEQQAAAAAAGGNAIPGHPGGGDGTTTQGTAGAAGTGGKQGMNHVGKSPGGTPGGTLVSIKLAWIYWRKRNPIGSSFGGAEQTLLNAPSPLERSKARHVVGSTQAKFPESESLQIVPPSERV